MSVKPAIATKLKKGKLLDVQQGFVDTFNWLVDFCSNLKGEGELGTKKGVVVDRKISDRPVIRGGGGGLAVADRQLVVVGVDWTGKTISPNYCLRIHYGRLYVNSAGKLAIEIDENKYEPTYIQTTPLGEELLP